MGTPPTPAFPARLVLALRLVAPAVLAYLGVCLVFFWRQDSYLFYPAVDSLTLVRTQAQAQGLTLWPRDDSAYLGLIAEPASVPVRGTYIAFHGNAGAAQHRDTYPTR